MLKLSPSICVISVVLRVGHRAFGIGLDIRSDAWNAKRPPFRNSVTEPGRDRLIKGFNFEGGATYLAPLRGTPCGFATSGLLNCWGRSSLPLCPYIPRACKLVKSSTEQNNKDESLAILCVNVTSSGFSPQQEFLWPQVCGRGQSYSVPRRHIGKAIRQYPLQYDTCDKYHHSGYSTTL